MTTGTKPPINIIRVAHDKTNPFFMMVRTTAQDESLSWEALGVLTYLLSKPDDWKVQVPDLQKRCGRDKAKKILAELEAAKYLTVDHDQHDTEGKFAPNQYKVNETPFTENPSTVKPSTENPLTENPQVHKSELDSTDQQNTEIKKNKDIPVSTDVHESSDSHPVEEKVSAVTQAIDHINKTTPPRSLNDLYQNAVKITFKIEFGSFNGRVVNFLTASEKNKGEWKEWQIDEPPMTPAEIVAFGDWYATAYKKAWEGNEKKVPITPQTANNRIMEFRAQPDYQKWVNESGAAFMARMEAETTPPEPPKELPPPNPAQAKKIDDVIAAMTRGEAISEYATL